MSARYNFKIGPANRHSGYAQPVSVLADNYGEAQSKAIAFSGWRPRDCNVWLINIEEVPAKEAQGDE